MRKSILFIVLYSFFLPVLTAEIQNNPQTLIITGSSTMPPLFFDDKNKNPAGFLVDFWKLWGEYSGYSVEFSLSDWNDSLAMVRNGEADIHAGLFYSETRNEKLDYSDEIFPLSTVMFIQRDLNINSINDLAGKKVAVVKGTFEEDYIRNSYKDIDIILFKNNEELVKSALRDNFHGFVSDYPVGMYFILKYGEINRYKVFKKLYTHQLKGAVKEGNSVLLQEINNGLALIPEEEKNLIFQKWIRREEVLPYWFVPFLIYGGLILLMVILFVHIYLLRIQVKRKTIELEKSKDSIKESAVQQQFFFQQLTHELKTPLTLIKNYLGKYILLNGIDDDLGIVENNVNRLINDVNNYLDSTKLSYSQVDFNHNQIINLSCFIIEKCIIFQETVLAKGLTFEKDIADDIYIKADPYVIDKILNNLIGNAVKYTDKGEIFISLKPLNNNESILEIRDTGIGIPKEQQNFIFDPYYQLTTKEDMFHGMGLGLYIVRTLLSSIGCKINIDSKPEKGTVFSIIFKQVENGENNSAIHTVDSPKPVVTSTIIKDVEERDIEDDKLNILIVEDNMEMLAFLQSTFKDEYNVYLAKNGRQALKKLEEISAMEVIISDIMMPVMNGSLLLEQLVKNNIYTSIPIIFLTAKSSEVDRISALSKGAIDYIYKPFNIDALKAKVNTIINSRITQSRSQSDNMQQKLMDFIGNMNYRDSIGNPVRKDLVYQQYDITEREREVVELLLSGSSTKEIADRIKRSPRTVEGHCSQIYKKMGISGRTELVGLLK